MEINDQRFAKEVLRRTLARAKALLDMNRGTGLSSTLLSPLEIMAVTNRATRLDRTVIDSYVDYFTSMNAQSSYREYDSNIELLVDVHRTKWPDFVDPETVNKVQEGPSTGA